MEKDVKELFNLSSIGADELVTKMYKAGLLESVEGYGKGLYWF